MGSIPATALPGRCEPMGAHARDDGVNFAVFSQNARRVELCLFDAAGSTELKRYELHGPHDGVFNGFLPGIGPGQVYGLRAHGSSNSLCALKRCPLHGSYGPCTRSP